MKIDNELVFHAQAIAGLRRYCSAAKAKAVRCGNVQGEWTGASRKYAIPLLEYLDRERVTRRDGDGRVVL